MLHFLFLCDSPMMMKGGGSFGTDGRRVLRWFCKGCTQGMSRKTNFILTKLFSAKKLRMLIITRETTTKLLKSSSNPATHVTTHIKL